jgi:hypothetical protein
MAEEQKKRNNEVEREILLHVPLLAAFSRLHRADGKTKSYSSARARWSLYS